MLRCLMLLFFCSSLSYGATIGEYRLNEAARSAYEAGNYSESLEQLSNALQSNPENESLLFNLGTVLAAQNDMDQAEQVLRGLSHTSEEGVGVDSLMALGNQALKNQDLEVAEKAFRTLLEKRADYVPAQQNLEYALRLKQEQQNQENQDQDNGDNDDEQKDSDNQDNDTQDGDNTDEQESDSEDQDGESDDTGENKSKEQQDSSESEGNEDKKIPGEVLLNLIEQKEKEARAKYLIKPPQEATTEFDW